MIIKYIPNNIIDETTKTSMTSYTDIGEITYIFTYIFSTGSQLKPLKHGLPTIFHNYKKCIDICFQYSIPEF